MPGGSKKGGGLEVKSAYKSYTPYKMKAANHNNSPFDKNYGAVAPGKMRSFDSTDGAINENMIDGVSQKSGLLYTEGGVGSSPAKGWLSNIAKGIGNVGKKVAGGVFGGLLGKKGGGGGGENPAVTQSVTGAGGADHTHPEFAQLDEAMQGGGGMQQQSIPAQKSKEKIIPSGMLGGIGNMMG